LKAAVDGRAPLPQAKAANGVVWSWPNCDVEGSRFVALSGHQELRGGPRPHQLGRSSHQAAKTGQRSRTASRPASARPSGGAELDRADLFSGILYLRPSGGESGSGRPGRG